MCKIAMTMKGGGVFLCTKIVRMVDCLSDLNQQVPVRCLSGFKYLYTT